MSRRGYGKPPKLYRWQVAYLKRAAKLRTQLTNAALAKKFGIGETTVQSYINDWGLHGCREDYDATIAASKRREGVLLPARMPAAPGSRRSDLNQRLRQ